ncbi:bifunctional riboflavin kinase/FAD synthetase [Candidatus Poribacteria bacterium]|nr:bifunctional riboflavin kinase/FAD synthetase [Candidatus Poribacteria bacterium]
MKIFHNFDKAGQSFNKIAVTIGNFDGIHLGHQKILTELKNEAEKIKGSAIAITFFPHPRSIIAPDKSPPLLSTLKDRLKHMQEIGIDGIILAHFDKKFAETTHEQFVNEYLINKLHIKKIIIGENYFFGKNKLGDINFLKKYKDFEVHAIPKLVIDEEIVSSSLIRNCISSGDLIKAKKLLGRDYSISGKIVSGSGRGRNIGFPTANLQALPVLLPNHGVYHTKVQHKGNYYTSITNIGTRPTFNEKETVVETYILNFDKSLYHEEITLHFIKKFVMKKNSPWWKS